MLARHDRVGDDIPQLEVRLDGKVLLLMNDIQDLISRAVTKKDNVESRLSSLCSSNLGASLLSACMMRIRHD